MDTYTYKCPGCGAELRFNPENNLLECTVCGNQYMINNNPATEDVNQNNINNGYADNNYANNGYTNESSVNNSYGNNANINNNYQNNGYLNEGNVNNNYGNNANINNNYQNNGYTNESSVNNSFGNSVNINNNYQNNSNANNSNYDDEYMDINIFHCSSCGAEIMANEVEISKFCSYCGQSAIIFDRVSREKRPAKIIPFLLSKDQAILRVKEKIRDAKFVSEDATNIKVDSVYGIYFPYWLYNAKLELGTQFRVKNNDNYTSYDRRTEKVHDVLLDASKKFNDYASKMLNPFPVDRLVDFNPAYLSGFYADKSDVESSVRENDAKEYLKEIVLEEQIASVPGAPSKQMRDEYGASYSKMVEKAGAFKYTVQMENYELYSKMYVMCPIYFVTLRVNNEHIIILVNGANGKFVGSVPYDKDKLKKKLIVDRGINMLIYAVIGTISFRYAPILWAGILMLILFLFNYMSGKNTKEKYEKIYSNVNTKSMFDLSKCRDNK